MMSVALQAKLEDDSNLANTRDASTLDGPGLLPTQRNGYIHATLDGWHRRCCVSQMSAKSYQLWTGERLLVSLITRLGKKLPTSWGVITLSHVARISFFLSDEISPLLSRWQGRWTISIHLWRSMDCHSEVQHRGQFARRDFLRLSPLNAHLYIEALCARWKSQAETPGVLGVLEKLNEAVRSIQWFCVTALADVMFTGHDEETGRFSFVQLMRSPVPKMLFYSCSFYHFTHSLLSHVRKLHGLHGSELVGNWEQHFSSELPHIKPSAHSVPCF